MLSSSGRGPAAVVVEPIACGLLKVGLTPNAVTVIGSLVTVAAAVMTIPQGKFFLGVVLIAIFAAFDMLDGTMARMRGGGTAFGATLDATCDRLTDGALFAAIAWWLFYTDGAPRIVLGSTLAVIIFSEMISYVKARAEAGGMKVNGGLIERPERIIIAFIGLLAASAGFVSVLHWAMIILAVASAFTVVQRLVLASRDPQAAAGVAAPHGAKSAEELRGPSER